MLNLLSITLSNGGAEPGLNGTGVIIALAVLIIAVFLHCVDIDG